MDRKFWHFVSIVILENGTQIYYSGCLSDKYFLDPYKAEKQTRDLVELPEGSIKDQIKQIVLVNQFEIDGGKYDVWREKNREYLLAKEKKPTGSVN